MTTTDFNSLITGFTDGGENTASELRTMLTAIRDSCLIPNEIKWIKMSSSDLTTYFQATGSTKGLGISGTIFEGWAICNGNNGTTNDNGLVSVAYGTDYTTLGATGGSKDAVVVSHTHTITAQYNGTDGAANGLMFPSGDSSGSGTPSTNDAVGGVSGTDKNMQPYVVELKIQRIA